MIYIDFGVTKDCCNHMSYGSICLKCNWCHRFGQRICPRCKNEEIRPGDMYCTECGKRLFYDWEEGEEEGEDVGA